MPYPLFFPRDAGAFPSMSVEADGYTVNVNVVSGDFNALDNCESVEVWYVKNSGGWTDLDIGAGAVDTTPNTSNPYQSSSVGFTSGDQIQFRFRGYNSNNGEGRSTDYYYSNVFNAP